jgi:N-acetylneuraminate synthase
MTWSSVDIRGCRVGFGHPCFIIAEAGVNHNGDIELAHKLVDEASAAGADAVKFQSFIAEGLVTPQAQKAGYQVETTGEAGAQFEMLRALELSAEQQAEIKAHCEELGIVYLCTPYEYDSVDMLDALGVAAYKVASTDTTNIPMLGYMARKGRPVILSTGMSTLGEVENAVNALRDGGLTDKIIILHCTSEYPAPVEEANLRAILTMQHAFGCPVGFSDHTNGIGASPWAVAIGACMIEKHFTFDRTMKGPDHRASLDPSQFASLVETIRNVEAALGDGIKRPMPSERANKSHMQKSLVARRDIASGELIVAEAIAIKRPGHGLKPAWLDDVVGRRAARDIRKNEMLTLAHLEWASKTGRGEE